ncbi:MAG TPA: amidohydrolase [Terracidiphilus sp.]|jgi:hippurate hydrolase
MNDREQSIKAISTEAVQWRHALHQNPQTKYEETFASDLICEKLKEWGIPFERGIAGTGVVATIHGRKNQSDRTIAFRADMDALDILEQSGQEWSSRVSGKMHGCGHDGHTASLLLLARYLNQTKNFDGLIRLIFQPAEEGGRGAATMLQEGLLNRFPFDEIYGYHNWPSLPRGVFAIRSGPIAAASDDFEIHLTGKGGHAAMPHFTRDVIPAAAHLVLALQTLVSRESDPMDSVVLSITNVSAGTGAVNVISGKASLTGTVRTFRQDIRERIEARMRVMADGVASMFQAETEVYYKKVSDPVINYPEFTHHCQAAAENIVGQKNVRDFEPVMGSEDFGGFLQVRPGAFIAIGQAEEDSSSPHNAMLHSPHYDFNDAILPIAATYFAELAESRLPIGQS